MQLFIYIKFFVLSPKIHPIFTVTIKIIKIVLKNLEDKNNLLPDK